jgi:hypothetical protein
LSHVFVLDTNKQPLAPTHPARARLLLASGKAAVFKRYPFTIILKRGVEEPVIQPLRIKLDPGSRVTGLAIVNDASGEVVFAAEIAHRGQVITERLQRRRAVRRSRRQRNTRYRKPRFHNRKQRQAGWLPPSLESRVCNLTLACERCNQAKGTRDIRDFLVHKPELLARLLAQARAPLQDAAAVNTTRWALYERLKALGLPVEGGSGGLTKYNRTQRGLPKQHWVDASCVGESTPQRLHLQVVVPLLITANGHGSRQMCLMDKRGFPRTKPKQARQVEGYQTGDIVKAVVTSGKKKGVYVGRVAVRASGFFNIATLTGTIEGINHRFCRPLHRVDGYSYQYGRRAAFPPSA